MRYEQSIGHSGQQSGLTSSGNPVSERSQTSEITPKLPEFNLRQTLPDVSSTLPNEVIEDLAGEKGICYDDIVKQEIALRNNKGRKPTITLAYDINQRPNQKLPDDDSNKSYAFWYDKDEEKRIILGTRISHCVSYMKYV
jgi:hypothetical protein